LNTIWNRLQKPKVVIAATLIGGAAGGIQLAVYLASASKYFLGPLQAALLMVLGAMLGVLLTVVATWFRTSEKERGFVNTAAGMLPARRSAQASLPAVDREKSRFRLRKKVQEPEQIVIARPIFGRRLSFLLLLLSVGTFVLGVVNLTAHPEREVTAGPTSSRPPDPSAPLSPSTTVATAATTAPTATTTTTTLSPYRYSSQELNGMLLGPGDLISSDFLKDVRLATGNFEQFVLPGWACRGASITAQGVSEDEMAEYSGSGPYNDRNIGSELMQFSSVEAALQFLRTVERAASGCGMVIRLQGELVGDQVLRLRDVAGKSTAHDRTFFRKGNIVGQVAVAITNQSTVASDSLLRVLASRIP